MTVKLIVQAEVKGKAQVDKLKSGLNSLGTSANVAKKKLQLLQATAARSRATFAALGTTLKVGVGVGLAAVTLGIGKFVKDTFAAGKLTESLEVRFKLLFNSATEGAKAFQVMNKFAAKVPFSLEAIAAGSGNLAVISKNAGDLNKILEVTGNVAAATGLDFRQTAEQIQRAFAGGIAAADVFRERGVRAMLGFEAGAKVSVEETKKKFFEVFANGGQYSQATKEFETTLEANVSFVQDAYFRFRQAAAEPLFGGVKAQLVELVGDFKKNDRQLKDLATKIGVSLSKGFKNLGDFIKFVVTNFELLVKGIKIFLALKVFGFVSNVGMAFTVWATKIKTVRRAFIALNLTMKANPIGLIILAIEGLVLGFILFEDKIKDIVSGALKNFNENLKHIQINFLKFKNLLNIGDEDVNLAAIEILEGEIRGLSSAWTEASEAKFAYLKGSRFDDNTKAIAKSIKDQNNAYAENRRMQVQNVKSRRAVSQAKELAEANKTRFRRTSGLETLSEQNGINPEIKRIKEVADAQNAAWAENRGRIQIESMEKGAANERSLEAIRQQREALSEIGIDSKSIATTIGDTWVNGIRAGNSLLQITKDSFKNILATIAETMLRKSIEYGVELLFQALLGKKVDKEKEVTKEKRKQFFWALATAAVGGGGGGGSFLGMAKGGVVPGGAPYTDRIPTMLTPGEVVIPRDKVGQQSGNTSITNINISGNVDQRSIDQIKGVISSASAEVGGANKAYTKNTQGVRGRNI